MDGRVRYLENIFIERLWRSLKREAIYLEEIADGSQVRRVIRDWIAIYNTRPLVPRLIVKRLTTHFVLAWNNKKAT